MRVFAFSLWMVGLSALCNSVAAQAVGEEYYVTIGVFGVQNNALRLTAKANQLGFNSQYAINPLLKLYYVYVFQSDDKRKAYAFLIKLRAETQFKDAWVFTGKLGEDQGQVVKEPTVTTEPVKEPVITEPVITEPVKIDPPKEIKQPVVKRVAKGKFFLFKFINEETGNEVRGEIHLSESKTATQYQAFKADEVVDVTPPRNADGAYF
ncbi:MAG TPA: SPOR domain-containing protein, partial [Cyclobacteriaceae bacterium]|nr:SPOR domain-containing protein [Cyclobacteriaceae bacterium]